MDVAAAEIEVEKLSRVLGVPAGKLSGLRSLSPVDIRAFRHRAVDALVDGDSRELSRIASAAGNFPAALSARLAERALGPVLTARVAGFGDADLILGVAAQASPQFLADVAVCLDPRHTADGSASSPPGRSPQRPSSLERRGEHAAMGVFVGYLGTEALQAAVSALSDDAILHVGALIEAPERLDEIVAGLSDERLTNLSEIAGSESRDHELEAVASHLGKTQLRRLRSAQPSVRSKTR